MSHPPQIVLYWKGPFSQWHPSRFELEGHDFTCAEQFMMHAKAKLFGDQASAQRILETTDPGEQKAVGRQVRGFDPALWDREKVAIVTRGNNAKFRQNKGLRRKLFQTGSALLAEASPIDTIWGIGLSADDPRALDPAKWPGQNLLGKILTDLREALRRDYPDEAEIVATDIQGVS